VPALQAPAAPHQSQQAFWCGGQAGVAPIGALDDPTAGVSPGRACPPWCLRCLPRRSGWCRPRPL
jgi:hypothetical protein